MGWSKQSGPCLVAGVAFLVCLIEGCAAGKPQQNEVNSEVAHIAKIPVLVRDFQAAHNNNLPKNIEDLKSWAVKKGKAEDSDFVSTRDGEPYVLTSMSAGGRVVIHEKVGQEGQMYVIAPNAAPTLQSEEQLKSQLDMEKQMMSGRRK